MQNRVLNTMHEKLGVDISDAPCVKPWPDTTRYVR